jgi:triosephosphate isomerase
MKNEATRRPFVGVSLKMQLSHAQTRSWLTSAATIRFDADIVDVAVLPSFTAINAAAELLATSLVRFGAQDCFWEDVGPFTGEVSPAVLRELGCAYVEVGHAERRRIFGEDNNMIARKAVAAAAYAMTPIICIGEAIHGDIDSALHDCLGQLNPVLAALTKTAAKALPVIVAYEPVWAIGAAAPAGITYIGHVVSGLRTHLDRYDTESRIIYGGSAGPGLFSELKGVDGLFLGRSALDSNRFAVTVAEVASTMNGHTQ